MFSSSFIHTFTQEEQNFVRWVTQITSLEKKRNFNKFRIRQGCGSTFILNIRREE
jgi:hypothetical protein